jgi:hypothetical protein
MNCWNYNNKWYLYPHSNIKECGEQIAVNSHQGGPLAWEQIWMTLLNANIIPSYVISLSDFSIPRILVVDVRWSLHIKILMNKWGNFT